MNKLQYGRDLASLIRAGMFLSFIISEIRELKPVIDQSLMLHNIYESTTLDDKQWKERAIKRNLKHLSESLSPRIKKINDHIVYANKMLKGLDFKHRIPTVKTSEVMSIVRRRLQTQFDVENAQKLSNEHFQMSLSTLLQKPLNAIQLFTEIVDDEKFDDEINKLHDPYKEGITQALSVCSIGYYSTSVFIAGKAMEEVVNDYCLELFRLHKIEKFDIDKEKFASKIGKLHGSKHIDEELFHRLSNVRIDRNEFGHPSKKLLTKKQAHLRIRFIAETIPYLEKKINLLRKK